MKALIITVGLIVFIAFWTYVGTVAFPFLAWLTGLGVVVLPAILLLFFSFCFLLGISLVPSRLFKRKIAKYILSVASPWFPVIILVLFSFDVLDIDPFLYAMMASCVLLLWCIFLVARRGYYYPFLWLPFVAVSIFTLTYIDENYGAHEYEGDYVLDRYGNNLYDRFGNKVFFKDYDEIEFVGDDKVRIEEWNDTRGDYDYGLYSLDKRRFIIPMGETIRSCCSIEQRNGRSGIVADGGDVVVSYKYETLEYWGDKVIGKNGEGEYVLFDELGIPSDDGQCYRVNGYYAIDDWATTTVYSPDLSEEIAVFPENSSSMRITDIFTLGGKRLFKVKYLNMGNYDYGIIDEDNNVMVAGDEDVTYYTSDFSSADKEYYIFAGNYIRVYSSDFSEYTTLSNYSSDSRLVSVYDYSSPEYYKIQLPTGRLVVVDRDGSTVISSCEAVYYQRDDFLEWFNVKWYSGSDYEKYYFGYLRAK